MSDLLTSLGTLISDLQELLVEAREKSPTLFSSAASARCFPVATLMPPPPSVSLGKASSSRAASNEWAKMPDKTSRDSVKMATNDKTKEAKVHEVVDESLETNQKPASAHQATSSPSFSQNSEKSKTESSADPLASKKTVATFTLEPQLVSDSAFLDQSTIAKRTQKLFPAWKLSERPPTDEEAVKIASAWKIRASTTEVLVLFFSVQAAERAFLANFATALQRVLAPAQLIDARSVEKENMWEAVLNISTLKAIYAPPLATWKAPHLLQLVKTIPASGASFIGSCPLYFLQNTEIYLQSPEQKRLLWKQAYATITASASRG